MQKEIKNYFDNTIELMNSISAIIDKKEVGLFNGIEEACHLVTAVADKGKKIVFIGNDKGKVLA